MNITVATDNKNPFPLQLSPETDVGTLKMVLEADAGIPSAQMRILFNGNDIQNNNAATLGSLGVNAGALLYVTRIQQQPRQPQQQQLRQQPTATTTRSGTPLSPENYIGLTFEDVPENCDPLVLREIIRVNPPMMTQLEHGNPDLAKAAANDNPQAFVEVLTNQNRARQQRHHQQQAELAALHRRVEENPYDIEAQKRVEEIIRARNVESNHKLAREHLPEAFTRVCMLYINAEVNGVPLKAFVDSGAQNTIMTQACAERAGIMRLIDTRYAGQAVGVGTCRILGKVHMMRLKIGDQNFNCSFTVLENSGKGQSVEFLLGLDMLKRHQAVINLKSNRLEIEGGTGTISVPFLGEAEIPLNDFNPSAKAKAGGTSNSSSRNSSSRSRSSGGGAPPSVPKPSSESPEDVNKQAEDLAAALLETMGAGGNADSTGSGTATTDNAAANKDSPPDQKRNRVEANAQTGAQTAALQSQGAPTEAGNSDNAENASDLDKLAATLMADFGDTSTSTTTSNAPAQAPATTSNTVSAPVAASAPAPAPAPAPAAAAAGGLAPGGVPVTEDGIAVLTAMGFTREQATQALFACGGDPERAATFLIQFS